jgi:hypothetical protein
MLQVTARRSSEHPVDAVPGFAQSVDAGWRAAAWAAGVGWDALIASMRWGGVLAGQDGRSKARAWPRLPSW